MVLKHQFTAFYSLVICDFFRQTESSCDLRNFLTIGRSWQLSKFLCLQIIVTFLSFCLFKTVETKIHYSENGGSKKRIKITRFFLKAKSCSCPLFKLSSPDQCTCSIVSLRTMPGGQTSLAIDVIHCQNLSGT